jgi:hypothetical protein
MNPICFSGFFKLLSEKDFAMQMYIGYIIEALVLSLPAVILQLLNNTKLDAWRTETFWGVIVHGANFIVAVRGILVLGDRMAEEENDQLGNEMRSKHEKQRKMLMQINEEELGDDIKGDTPSEEAYD